MKSRGSSRSTLMFRGVLFVALILLAGAAAAPRPSTAAARPAPKVTLDAVSPVTFTITPAPGPNGWIGPPIPQSVPAGGSLTCSINAYSGYHVADVLVDDVSVGAVTSYEFTNVQADHTISATFAEDTVRTFTITPAPGPNGWIGPPTPQSVPAGGSLTCSINAYSGYHVADVLVDDVSVGAVTSYEFTNVQADHTISAGFAPDVGPTVTVSSPAGGEVWRRGSVREVRWTLSAPVGTGRFTVWASSPSGDLTQLTPPGSAVAAVGGNTDYRWSYTVALPAAETYEILVRYESDAGEVQSEARSSGRVSVVSGTRISVTRPRGTVTWRRGSNQMVRWRLSEAVTAGDFRVWAVSAKGTRYRVTRASTPVVAAGGRTLYSARWKVNAPAGKGYRIVVEHWWSAIKVTSGKSTGRLTIKR